MMDFDDEDIMVKYQLSCPFLTKGASWIKQTDWTCHFKSIPLVYNKLASHTKEKLVHRYRYIDRFLKMPCTDVPRNLLLV